MALSITHLELKEANELVAKWHRHHKPIIGHRFSIGVMDNKTNELVGAAIVGRSVARNTDQIYTLEVTRLVTDGTKNACSFLYSACARAGKELGYKKIHTYILDTETGISLIAAGWVYELTTSGGSWGNRKGRRDDQPEGPKLKYSRILCT